MTFKENARLDTSQVGGGGGGGLRGGGRRGGGGVIAGGGIGSIILLVLYMIFGGGIGGGGGGGGAGAGPWNFSPSAVSDSSGTASDFSHCKTGADANEHQDCLVIGTVNSVQNFWGTFSEYEQAKTIIFQDSVQTGCGMANSQVGPFYCPVDSQVYIDVAFFDQLKNQLGADGGSLSQMYVVAHEYGHHVQDLQGVLGRAQQDPQGADSGAVRTELQADCYAGVWVAHADGTRDGNAEEAILEPITKAQIESALSAAAAVGDDRIQEQMQGRVTPESWTHGSAEQRQKWFLTGYESGDPNQCDTFSAQDLG